MRSVPSRSILSVALSTALAVSTLSALSVSAQAATRHADRTGVHAVAPKASASGFLFYVLPTPQPACTGIGLNASSDPALDRAGCGFTEFTVTGAEGAVLADLYGEGQEQPFATGLAAEEDSQSPGTYQVSLEPAAGWPAGRITMVLRDT